VKPYGNQAQGEHGAGAPRIYFARAIDGMSEHATLALAGIITAELADVGLRLIDPLAEQRRIGPALKGTLADKSRQLVDFDLSILRTCSGVLMDMSIPNRNYIGCSCELTYAYLWRIPVAVHVGQSDLTRPWLHYHARAVCLRRSDAISALVQLLRDGQ